MVEKIESKATRCFREAADITDDPERKQFYEGLAELAAEVREVREAIETLQTFLPS